MTPPNKELSEIPADKFQSVIKGELREWPISIVIVGSTSLEEAIGLGDQTSLRRKIRDFLWGLFLYDLYLDAVRTKVKYKDALNLFLLGQFLGLPLMNSSISLRLLPHLLPELGDWKRRQLKEREIIESTPPTV